MTGQAVEKRTPQQELVAQIRAPQFKEQVSLALPGDVSPERFIRATITALMQNPDLTNADRESLFYAVIRSAQDGLLPDGREAALVMFGQKAAYLPMVAGYRKIAGEHGWAIRSAVVYENDTFKYELGLAEKLVHVPVRPGRPRGKAIAAVAVGAHKDGRREFEVMDAAEIEKVRKASRSANKGPWVDWTERMWEKTVARRLFKKLPLGDRELVERVLAADSADPAAELYGPGGSRFQPTPAPPLLADAAAPRTGVPESPAGDGHGGGGRQVEPVGDSPPSPEEPAGSTPDDDDERFTRADAAAEAAASFRIPDVRLNNKPIAYIGLTLAEAADKPDGLDYFKWALHPRKPWNRDDSPDALFGEALRAYGPTRFPELFREAA